MRRTGQFHSRRSLSNWSAAGGSGGRCMWWAFMPPRTMAGWRRHWPGGAEVLGTTVTYVLPAAVRDVAQSLPRGPLPPTYHALGQILGAGYLRRAVSASGAELPGSEVVTARLRGSAR